MNEYMNDYFAGSYAGCKPVIHARSAQSQLEDLAWKFQRQIVDVFEDAAEAGMQRGDDLHLHLVEQMNSALLIAKYVQRGHIDLAASRLGLMAGEYINFGTRRSRFADEVWRLMEQFSLDSGVGENEDKGLDVDRPGLF